MLRHHLNVLIRVAVRSGIHSFVTIVGLALGLTVCLLALVTVWQETHYDTYHRDADRLYMVETRLALPGRQEVLRNTSMAPLAQAAQDTMPQVAAAARVWRQWDSYWRGDNLNFSMPAYFVDPSFFDMFSFDMIAGDPAALFSTPNAALLSESMAQNMFGGADALGQTISEARRTDLTVVGIYRDLPQSTHLDVDLIVPMTAPHIRLSDRRATAWDNLSVVTYLKLAPGAQADSVDAAITRLLEDRFSATAGDASERGTLETSLIPVTDIHLWGGPYEWPMKPRGDADRLLTLATIGGLVLLIACFNHINISTARAMLRSREVALRKVVGARRSQLIVQFLGEAALYCACAWTLALALTEVFLPHFSALIGVDVPGAALWDGRLLILQALLFAAVTVVSGMYPALYLSRFHPEQILRGSGGSTARHRVSLRSVLVVLQFAISIALVIATAVIYGQTRFAHDADLGFEAENLIALYGIGRGPEGTIRLSSALDDSISHQPGVISVAGASAMPSWDYRSEARIRAGGTAAEAFQSVGQVAVDLDYVETYGLTVLAGRGFSEDYAADRVQWDLGARGASDLPLIINQQAVLALGYQTNEEALDQTTIIEVSPGVERSGTIVGIVRDFHFRSLRSAIGPMVLYPDPTQFSALTVKIDPARREEAIAGIEKGWQAVLANQGISRDFVDRDIQAQYGAEMRQLNVIGLLAVLAVVIATMGLYGLATFSIERRIKEIGIRKVLGAGTGHIVRMMVWQFSQPVLVANLIAWPTAWYFASNWLERFAYRIELTPTPFAVAAMMALLVAGLVVGLQALRTAQTNPVHALRYE